MGVAGLWEVLKPAVEVRSMTELAITEGFIANPQGLRGFRIGIDASIWFFHAEYGKKGENPVLRTLFFRCATLMRTTFLPLFVFDGPKRPNFKRGKKINKTRHQLIPGMKAIIEAFGFEWRMAPAEAEAELAYLNRAGIIDAVLSDDVDNFLFGATTVIRNLSNNLSGNRANPILNSEGRDDKNHTGLYRALTIRSHSSISLTRGGFVLIGLLSGGDYAQAGLPGCGITTAHALARCGFGDSLYEAATTLPADALPNFLAHWRQDLQEELRTNSRGIIGRKLKKLAKEVPNSFPNIDILLSYTNPITSESLGCAAEKNMKLTWGKEPDVGKLAATCEFYFEWGYKEAIIKRSRTLLWHSIVLRILRRAVINAETSDYSSSSTTMPSTPRKGKDRAHPRIINTPSKMVARHFASMGLNSPESGDEGPLIVKIHSSRNHASTDGLLEYRLEVAPAQLVRLAESGIKRMREPSHTDEWTSEEDVGGDNADSDAGKKTKGLKPPPDPTSHLRLWMPACMVEMAEPEIVEEYNERRSKKASKENGKAREESGATKQSKNKVSKSQKPLYDSDTDQQLPLEDMLAKRKATIQSTPSLTRRILQDSRQM
ncbi:PIN domain-like protein [Amanita rubescens]|nr:PIN domain-like protein [Amanita rubescens]